MKKTILHLGTLAFAFIAIPLHAEIIAGPVVNPANGHEYYLLSPGNWTDKETEAENLGGTLAVIRNAAEQEWFYSQFGTEKGATRNVWLGLHREYPGGPFAWATGEPVTYLNWDPGQPDNGGGVEDCGHIWQTDNPQNAGKWNDGVGSAQMYGVAEVPGKTNPESLGSQEKSLVGTWYEAGRPDQPCFITATRDRLFTIDCNRNASRLIRAANGLLFAANAHIHGELVGDKIVWSNGRWWSRSPVKFSAADKNTPAVQ